MPPTRFVLRFPTALLFSCLLPLACWAQAPAPAPAAPVEQRLRVDRARSYVDVDVEATLDSFTGRLERYDAQIGVDAGGRIKTAVLQFKFSNLKTGKAERDARMLEWLGGGEPAGVFSLGVLALAPDGQGQANGRLTFHGTTERVEFPVLIVQRDGTYTITGRVTFDYRNWGLKALRFMGVRKVKPEVTVRFQFVGELPAAPVEE